MQNFQEGGGRSREEKRRGGEKDKEGEGEEEWEEEEEREWERDWDWENHEGLSNSILFITHRKKTINYVKGFP